MVRIRIFLAFHLIALAFPASRLAAQSELELFYGGILSASVRITSPGLGWVTGSFVGLGSGISQLSPGAESVRWNPGGLAFLSENQLYSEWLPPFKFNLNRYMNLEQEANLQLRRQVMKYARDESSLDLKEFIIQPSILLDGGQGNIAAVVKTRKFNFGGAVHAPVQILADLSVSGLKTRAATQSATGGTTIRFLGLVNGSLSVSFEMTGLSVAMGKRLGERWGIGLGFDAFAATLNASAFFRPEALVSSGARDFAFNDTTADHYNNLDVSMGGQLSGEGGRWRIGLGYHPGNSAAIDVALFLPATLDFSGKLTYAYNQILAFNLNADENTPFFDANILLEEGFTGTHPRWTTLDRVRLTIPGQLALSGALLAGSFRMGFTLTNYYKDFSLGFSYTSAGDSTATQSSGSWVLALTPQHAFYAVLGVPWLTIRLGALRMISRSEKSTRSQQNQSEFWLPLLGMTGGFDMPYFKRLRLDYDVSLGLTSLVRFATTYRF